MAYFVDFSEYSYSHWFQRPGTLNIGWLDHVHPYEKSETPEDVIDLLWTFCNYSIAQARGFYLCDLSDCTLLSKDRWPLRVLRAGNVLKLGSAEIRVFGNDGLIYAAPNLVFHYVTAHQYKLPDRFIGALRSGPSPGSVEYQRKLSDLGLRWTKTLGQCSS